MTDRSVYGGLFQDPPTLSTDPDPKKTDPYVKEDCISSRYLGKSMLAGRPAPGLHPDVFFGKQFLTLASSEQNSGKAMEYVDAATADRRAAMQAKAHNISKKEFKYASVPQRSTGPGSYYGCIQKQPYEYMTEPWDDGRKKKRRPKPPPEELNRHFPNVKTNPSKKGTYGYPGLLLQNPPYDEGWREELAAHDKQLQKRERKAAAPPKPLGPAFRAPGVSRAYLDELPGTGVPGVYAAYTPPEESKKRRHKSNKVSDPPVATHTHAFRYTAAMPRTEGTINPFPNVWVDPAEVEAQEAKKRRGQRRKMPAAAEPQRLKGAGEWKPNSFPKTSIVTSCLRRFY